MDFDRQPKRFSKWLRFAALAIVGIGAIVGVSIGLGHLVSTNPSIDRRTVLIDTVKRAVLVHQVRGVGTLTAEEFLWIPAQTEGRIVNIVVQAGAAVDETTVLLELSNPDLELAVINADSDVKAAVANFEATKARLQKELYTLQAKVVKLETEFEVAQFTVEIDEKLLLQNVVTKNTVKLDRLKADGLKRLLKVEQQGLEVFEKLLPSEYGIPEAEIAKAKAILKRAQDELAALKVVASLDGILEQLEVEIGQHVTPGVMLAKVSKPRPLKAELKIPEVQARFLQLGQRANIDTHHGIAVGMVDRIDPAVTDGSVTVEVTFDGPLPEGARPDLSIVGTVEIERRDDVLQVGRPVFASANSTLKLFKLGPNGKFAIPVPVKIGIASVSAVEILDGLEPDDRVILTDMSRWDDVDRIELE